MALRTTHRRATRVAPARVAARAGAPAAAMPETAVAPARAAARAALPERAAAPEPAAPQARAATREPPGVRASQAILAQEGAQGRVQVGLEAARAAWPASAG